MKCQISKHLKPLIFLIKHQSRNTSLSWKIRIMTNSRDNTSKCWKSYMMNTQIKCQISKHLLIKLTMKLQMKANSKNNSNSLKTRMRCKTRRSWTQTISRIYHYSNHLDSMEMAKVEMKIPKNVSSLNSSTNYGNSTARWIRKMNMETCLISIRQNQLSKIRIITLF